MTDSDVASPPGGWLDQDHVKIVQAALRSLKNTHTRLRRQADQHCGVLTADTNASASYLASQRAVVRRYAAMLERDDETIAVFAAIEHGARVEALPSPEEERAHHVATLLEDLDIGMGAFASVYVHPSDLDAMRGENRVLRRLGRAKLDELLGEPVTGDELEAAGWTMDPDAVTQHMADACMSTYRSRVAAACAGGCIRPRACGDGCEQLRAEAIADA